MQKENISLISIPYWWDMRMSSLKATLYQHRPDLFTKEPTGLSIPTTKPSPQGIYIYIYYEMVI